MSDNLQVSPPLRLRHLVDGVWVDGAGDRAVSLNPAYSDRPVATYQCADEALLDRALNAAESAQRSWADMGLIGRGLLLRRVAALLEQRVEGIAQLMTAEHGKAIAESRVEVNAAAETFYYHAGRARAADGATFPSSHPDELIRTLRVPVGTVAVITPWNFPIQIPAWKIAPALLWGNTVVWKPASDTPAVAVALAEAMMDAGLPAGVLNLLLAPGSIGASLVGSDRVAAVSFTGSVPVGRSIAATATARGAKVQLELGGHNAAIVLPDADPATVAQNLVAGAMSSTGQKCTATRRIIAVGDAYAALLPELCRRVRELVVGDGADPATGIGPVISAQAKRDVEQAIRQALVEGAEVLAEAATPNTEGNWVAPTLLAGSPDLTICQEEVFGPVSTLLRAADLDQAITLANATAFGLTAAVFSTDERAARRCVNELVAGLVKVNAPTTGSELHAPFGGLKDSSFPAPREQNGDTSADFFTWTKTAYLRTIDPRTSS